MGERVNNYMQWIEYKGTRILFADYGALRDAELVTAIKANEAAIVEMGKAGMTGLRILTDTSDIVINEQAIDAFKSVTRAMRPYTLGSAIVGVTGIRKFALELVNLFSKMDTRPFDSFEKAKDWLHGL